MTWNITYAKEIELAGVLNSCLSTKLEIPVERSMVCLCNF